MLDVTPPPGYDISDYWGRPNTSDRYAAFWNRVYDLAAERNPDVKITTFLYWQTFQAPWATSSSTGTSSASSAPGRGE